MTSLPIPSGPSETLDGAIAWFAQFSAALFTSPKRQTVELAHEAGDHVASLLHFYHLLETDHNQWVAQLPDAEPTPQVCATANRYAASFRNWHTAATALLKVAQRLRKNGCEIAGVDDLQDRIGFCPYIGISVEQWIASARNPVKEVSLGEVRDGLRRRLHVQSR